jgi:three-Cys-motif partner protein
MSRRILTVTHRALSSCGGWQQRAAHGRANVYGPCHDRVPRRPADVGSIELVTAPQEVPWPITPHTAAKHDLYRQYLSKWFPILVGSWGGRATYAEGFAGPGVYTKGEPGSPVIALRTLWDSGLLGTATKRVRLLFVDDDARCVDWLQRRLELTAGQRGCAVADLAGKGVEVELVRGQCDAELEPLLDRHDAWRDPLLVNLDTWGAAVPARLLQRVAGTPAGEVIITMGPSYFMRFASVDEYTHGDEVFGGDHWRAVQSVPSQAKAAWLLEAYRTTVTQAGFRFVLDFTLVDQRGQLLYLVFGTTSRKGLVKMKEAMWEVDAVHGVGYRDPRDPDQQTLEIEFDPVTGPLRRLVLAELARRPARTATEAELRDFALLKTVYKEAHASQAIRELIEAGQVLRAGEHRPGFVDTLQLP